jgi:hypothetical protein
MSVGANATADGRRLTADREPQRPRRCGLTGASRLQIESNSCVDSVGRNLSIVDRPPPIQ